MKYIKSYPNIAAYRADEDAENLLVYHIDNNTDDFVSTNDTITIYNKSIQSWAYNLVDLLISLSDTTWEDIGITSEAYYRIKNYPSYGGCTLYVNGRHINSNDVEDDGDRVIIYAGSIQIYISEDESVNVYDNRPM